MLLTQHFATEGNHLTFLERSVQEFTDTERKTAMADLPGRTRVMLRVMRMAPQWMIHAYIRLAVVKTAGKGWVEYCKKQLSPPDLRNPAITEAGLMDR